MPHVDDGQLHAWLDGETSDIDAEKIDGHLAKCDECTGRLDEIARVHALAGKLVHRAQAEEAPAWKELLARAQGADEVVPPVAEREPIVVPVPARGMWTPRLLTSGLAWAATLVLAFGLGWYAGLRPGEVARSKTETQLPVASPTIEPQTTVMPSERLAGDAAAKQEGSPDSEDVVGPLAATELEAPEPRTDDRNELAEKRVAAATEEPPPAIAGRGLVQATTTPVPQAQLRATPTRERRTVVEASGARLTDAVARDPESDDGPIAPRDVAAWLGKQPLRLEGAALTSARVGPLAAGPGSPSAPGIWLLFDDPQTRTRVAVAQRRWPRDGAADQTALPADADTAVLTVVPDGSRQLWWITADGYLVLITADVDEATLRDLAQRLR